MEKIKLIQEIAGSHNWTFIEEIKRGWSSDRKFFIETQDNEKLLLRISHINT